LIYRIYRMNAGVRLSDLRKYVLAPFSDMKPNEFKKEYGIARGRIALPKLLEIYEAKFGNVDYSKVERETAQPRDVRRRFKLNVQAMRNIDGSRSMGLINEGEHKHIMETLGNTTVFNDAEQKAYLADEFKRVKPLKMLRGIQLKTYTVADLELNAHQNAFIKHYIMNSVIGAIMFHGVGSGKTLTAVALSKYYLAIYPENEVYIISPPALIDNFAGSIIQFGGSVRDNRYKFMTYVKFLNSKANLSKAMLIIDEAHNFRTYLTIGGVADTDEGEGKLMPTTGKRVYNLMEKVGKCDKVVLLTGTAFVNELYDIENLIQMTDHTMAPHDKDDFYKIVADPTVCKSYFRYRVSHYMSPQDNKFFPGVINQILPVIMTKSDTYTKKESKILADNKKRAFYTGLRRLANTFVEKDGDYPAKIQKIIDVIIEQDNAKRVEHKGTPDNEILYDKSIIYTGFLNTGVVMLRKALDGLGIGSAVISGKVSAGGKSDARMLYNKYSDRSIPISVRNSEYPRILIITKAGAEGVDTVFTKNLFMLDGVWNEALAEQITARAVRFKSHYELDASGKIIPHVVNVFKVMYIRPAKEGIIDEPQLVGQINDGLKKKSEYNLGFDYTKLLDGILEIVNEGKAVAKDADKKEVDLSGLDDAGKFKYQVDIKRIKATVREELKGEPRIDIKNEIERRVKQYWKENGLRYAVKNLEADLVKSLGEALSIDLLLFIKANAKQQIILEFIEFLDKKIDGLEDMPINQEEVQIIKSVLRAQAGTGRALTQDEWNDISIKIRTPGTKDALEKLKKANDAIDPGQQLLMKLKKKVSDRQASKLRASLQEFFTPPDMVTTMIGASHLDKFPDGGEPLLLLEPTAGHGHIAGEVIRHCLEKKIPIERYSLVEFSASNRQHLADTIGKLDIVEIEPEGDFLNYCENTRYDYIFMNPPFNITYARFGKNHVVYDLAFVIRAFDFLKPGGQLVALVYGTHVGEGGKYAEENKILFELGAVVKHMTVEWATEAGAGRIDKLPLAMVVLNKSKKEGAVAISPEHQDGDTLAKASELRIDLEE
jgi:hypothetical protein